MHVLLINDTRRDPNPGCQATVASLVRLIEEQVGLPISTLPIGTGYEYVESVPVGQDAEAQWRVAVDRVERDPQVRDAFDEASLVVVNLEGTFHDSSVGARALGALMAIACRRGLPVWAVNGTVMGVEPWLLAESIGRAAYLAVREPLSAIWLESQGIVSTLSADCAFLADIFEALVDAAHVPARSVLYTPGVFGRPDQSQRVTPDDVVRQLTVLADRDWQPVYFEMEPAEAAISARVREHGWPVVRVDEIPWAAFGSWLRRFDLVVSGRYHVLLFAAMAGTPWVALPSNTWKIEGLLQHLDDQSAVVRDETMLAERVASMPARPSTSMTIEQCRQFASLNLPELGGRRQRPARAVLVAPTAATRMPVLVPARDIVHVPWPPERLVPGEASRTLAAALKSVPSLGGMHLVAGLERVPASEMADLLRTLRDNCDGPVAVSVDTAPDPEWNRTHTTVRPASVWRHVFEAAGFEVTAQAAEAGGVVAHDTWSVRAHWARLNPFRDAGGGHRRTFLLQIVDPTPERASAEPAIGQRLGVTPPVNVPAVFSDPEAHLVFLVGTYQEFRQYLAIWPHLPAGSYSVLLRTGLPGAAWTRRERCIEAWLASRGVTARSVRSVRDIAWTAYRHRRVVLVSGAESSAYDSHLWNSAVVVVARQHGWRTVQLQHGIWPYADLRRPMTMASDVLLTWSGEFEREMRTVVAWPDGARAPRGEHPDLRYVAAGNPVFDRYAMESSERLEDLLGDWVSRYARRLLVATNLHWTQHAQGGLVDPAILTLAAEMPDTLFIAKLHPVHDVDEAMLEACPDNVHVLDEFACLFAELDSPRLVRATDGVVATQSTVALEAALAHKPFVIVDTGNPNRYRHAPTVPVDLLHSSVAAMSTRPEDAAFCDHYFDRGLLGSGLARVLDVVAAELESPSPVRREGVALGRFADAFSAYASDLLGTQAELENTRRALRDLDAHRVLLVEERRDVEQTQAAVVGDLQAQMRWVREELEAETRWARQQLEAKAQWAADELAAQDRWARTELETQRRWAESELAQVAAALEAERAARSMSEDALMSRDRSLLLAHPGRRVRVGLFGAGLAGRQQLARVRGVPHLEVRCFLDNNPASWATALEGLPVLKPEPGVFDGLDVIVVSSQQGAAIAAQISAAGYAHKLLFDNRALDQLALHLHSA